MSGDVQSFPNRACGEHDYVGNMDRDVGIGNGSYGRGPPHVMSRNGDGTHEHSPLHDHGPVSAQHGHGPLQVMSPNGN